MVATLDFFGGFAVDMSDPPALYAGHVFADFPSGFFYGDELDFGDGASAPLVLIDETGFNEVRLWGSGFTYDASGVTGGAVSQLEVYNLADLETNYTLPETYRLTLTFDQPVAMAAVVDALTSFDLTPLYAGQALDVFGDALGDTLVGGIRADALFGFGGDDSLLGRGGNDTLAGSSGHDVLRGAAGADSFWFVSAGAQSADTVLDFKRFEGDRLFLDNGVFSGLGADGRLAAWKFHAGADVTGHGGSGIDPGDRILYDTDSGHLYYDANGSAAGERVLIGTIFATGDHHPSLVAGDFRVL